MKRVSHIPGIARKKFWEKKWFQELVFNVPPIFAAVFTAINLHHRGVGRWYLYIASGIGIWLLIGLIIKVALARRDDAKDEPEVVHEGVFSSISTLHAVVTNQCVALGFSDDIRATFHRVIPPLSHPTQIEQIVPYVGSRDGGMGRKFSINTGITGQAIRSETPITMSSISDNEASHRTELINGWGYTEAQARSLTPGRYSAVAIPVLNSTGQHVLGVIYLDSSSQNVFDSKEVQQLLMVACNAVSHFVTQRY